MYELFFVNMVAMVMNTHAKASCTHKNTFVNRFFCPNFTEPFKIPTTWNLEMYSDGYIPEAMLVTTRIIGRQIQRLGSLSLKPMSKCHICSKPGMKKVIPKMTPM